MDTIIAVVIIIVAACYVVNKLRKQLSAKEGAGCGCSGGCSPRGGSGSCCGSAGDQCSGDK